MPTVLCLLTVWPGEYGDLPRGGGEEAQQEERQDRGTGADQNQYKHYFFYKKYNSPLFGAYFRLMKRLNFFVTDELTISLKL